MPSLEIRQVLNMKGEPGFHRSDVPLVSTHALVATQQAKPAAKKQEEQKPQGQSAFEALSGKPYAELLKIAKEYKVEKPPKKREDLVKAIMSKAGYRPSERHGLFPDR